MKINLVRNLNTNRDKEQEDSFENTMNFALYFDINKTIYKIDGWKLSNVRRLLENINESSTTIDIEFSKWDDNVELLYNSKVVSLIQIFDPSENLINSLRNRAFPEMYEYLKEIKEDKNLKMEFLFTVANELKNNLDAVTIINEFVNNGISTLDVAIDAILPLLILEEENE